MASGGGPAQATENRGSYATVIVATVVATAAILVPVLLGGMQLVHYSISTALFCASAVVIGAGVLGLILVKSLPRLLTKARLQADATIDDATESLVRLIHAGKDSHWNSCTEQARTFGLKLLSYRSRVAVIRWVVIVLLGLLGVFAALVMPAVAVRQNSLIQTELEYLREQNIESRRQTTLLQKQIEVQRSELEVQRAEIEQQREIELTRRRTGLIRSLYGATTIGTVKTPIETGRERTEALKAFVELERFRTGGIKVDLLGAQLQETTLVPKSLDWLEALHRGDAIDPSFDLSGVSLESANLTNIDWYVVNLSDARLARADLRNAKLPGAILFGATLRHADLRSADLTLADFRHCDLRNVTIDEQTAIAPKWRLVTAIVSETGFASGHVRKWREENPKRTVLDLSGADLERVHFYDTNLDRANLANCLFTDANLSDSELMMADCSNCRFQRADLSHASFLMANLSNSSFDGADMENVSLDKAVVDRADWIEWVESRDPPVRNFNSEKWNVSQVPVDAPIKKLFPKAKYWVEERPSRNE